MIQHSESRTETTVADRRGATRGFGYTFVVAGLFSVVMALSGTDQEDTTRLAVFGIGAMSVAGGLHYGWGEHRTAAVTGAGVVLTRYRLFASPVVRHVASRAVRSVEVEQGRDSDGDATFRPVLRLASDETVWLTLHTTNERERAAEVAAAVARQLEMPERVEA